MNAPITDLIKTVAAETAFAADGVQRLDAQATNSAAARSLYKARVPIHPKLVHGQFRRLKWIGMAIMLAIYYGVPWLRWERAGNAADQAVLVDLARERFYFFWIEIWPQEIYYLTGLLIIASLGLFLVTALFGRVWCGYACPQTVWTDLFIMVERLVEGDRNARIRLDKSAWTLSKVGRRAAKHAIWLVIAAATGGAWIFYFHDAPTLAQTFFAGTADITAYAFFGVFTFTTYWLAGHMREQVCTYMCPWPRIQAALIDHDTMMVTYRTDRGEQRGPHKKGQPWEGRGHCVDCRQCVAACPMGIDIRDGDQLECINCALCIDACDDVMKRVGLPAGLIGYDTHDNIDRRKRGEAAKIRLVRPRTVLYAALLAIVAAIMLISLSTRSTIDLTVSRERNPAFVRLSDGSVRNAYVVKIMNRSNVARTFSLSLNSDAPSLTVKAVGVGAQEMPFRLQVEPDRIRTVRILATVAGDAALSTKAVAFRVADEKTGEASVVDNVFLSGDKR
jgi:cytochrome c oxidase accessory protein FixG